MKIKKKFPVVLLMLLFLAGCQAGGGGYPSAPQAAATPAPAATAAPGYYMGPGMQHNFGMMSDNVYQMHQMMGQGYMSPDHYNQMMGMMGQMGGMMHEMGGPYYNQEMQQRHQQQLEGMHRNLGAVEKQGRAPGASAGAGIFASRCASCHPNGGNIFNPDLPLKGAPQLGSYSSFKSIVRQGRGPMPAFSSYQISDSQLRELYRYVRSAYGG